MDRALIGQVGVALHRHVVHLAIRDQDSARDAVARHVAQRVVWRGPNRSVSSAPGLASLSTTYDPRFDIAKAVQLGFDRFQGRVGAFAAFAEMLAGRAIDHDDQRDILERLALLLDQRRVEQRQDQCRPASAPRHQRPRPPPDKRHQRGDGSQADQRRKDDPRQQRREVETGQAVHWPSRSRMKRSCTRSSL